MNVEEIRGQVRQSLLALDNGALSLLSRTICDRFVEACRQAGVISVRWNNQRVALYRGNAHELELSELDRNLRSAGARIHFPRVIDRAAGTMEFVEMPPLADQSELWSEGHFGLKEPHPRLLAVPAAALDLVFVPALAFGEHGERVGRGAGYYDRFLAGNARALRVGLALDIQVFEQLQQNPWDQPVDWVMTETRDLRGIKAVAWLNAAT